MSDFIFKTMLVLAIHFPFLYTHTVHTYAHTHTPAQEVGRTRGTLFTFEVHPLFAYNLII